MENAAYLHWSKSSVYLLALRNKEISFCQTTFYKHSKLLGYGKSRHLQSKIKYSSLTSYKPNEIWCADVTILKTADGKKHYIHFLMDHYSKMILGYRVENSSSPRTIKNLLHEAYLKHKSKDTITLVTDGGVENVNNTKKNLIPNLFQHQVLVFPSIVQDCPIFQFCPNIHILNNNSLYGAVYYKRIVLGTQQFKRR